MQIRTCKGELMFIYCGHIAVNLCSEIPSSDCMQLFFWCKYFCYSFHVIEFAFCIKDSVAICFLFGVFFVGYTEPFHVCIPNVNVSAACLPNLLRRCETSCAKRNVVLKYSLQRCVKWNRLLLLFFISLFQ